MIRVVPVTLAKWLVDLSIAVKLQDLGLIISDMRTNHFRYKVFNLYSAICFVMQLAA